MSSLLLIPGVMIYKLMNTTGTILEVNKGEIEFAKRINQVPWDTLPLLK